MKKLKNQKGITLVALIITIIVLLILAVVAIREITGNGIIAKAKEARSTFETKQGEENGILADYEDAIEELYSDGMTIDKILNKAYTAENQGVRYVYYFTQEDGKTYLNANVYDIETDKKEGTQQVEISLTNEFDTIINITVNGSKVQISSANAVLMNVRRICNRRCYIF